MIDSSASDSSVSAVPFPSIRPILWHRRDQTGTQRTPSSLLATPRLTSSASPSDRIPLRGICPSLRCHLPFMRSIDLHRRDMTRTQRIPSPLESPRLTPTASPCRRFLCVVFPRLCGATFRLLAQSIYTAETKLERREYLPLSLKPLGSHPPHHSVVDSSAFYFPVSAVPPSVYSPNPLAPQRPNQNAENTFHSTYLPSAATFPSSLHFITL